MIGKLQRKFVLIAMGSLLLILLVLVCSINAMNLYHMNRRLDGVLHTLAEHGGDFPEFEGERPPFRLDLSLDFQMTPETRFETRYFTVHIAPDGSFPEINIENIAAIDPEQAGAYAQEILDGGRRTGYLSQYKYLLQQQEDGALLVVLDCRTQLQAVTAFFLISCSVGLLSLVLMFVLVTVFSRRALRPFQRNVENQKQFITDAGHELKTPLAIISSNADVLELKHGDDQWVASIHRQVARMDVLIKKLLTLARMDEETVRESFSDFHLEEVVLDAAKSFRPMAEAQGKTLTHGPFPSMLLRGDKEEIRQLLSILLDNAVKYADEHGGIEIRLYASGKRAVLEVWNSLDRCPDSDPDRLFDRFFRTDPSRSREQGGYGIGLSIAKAITHAHKGDIRAVYEGDSRICFRVQLPGMRQGQ